MKRTEFLTALGSTLVASSPTIKNTSIPSEMLQAKLIKPKRLKAGDLVTLITPSSSVNDAIIQRAVKNIESLGFRTKLGKYVSEAHGYLAGSEKNRLEDLHNAFSDKETSAVWCIRGGYGAARLLPNLDFKLIRNNPKILIGYSDITALHLAIHQNCNLVTFHGPVGNSDFNDFTKDNVCAVLTGDTPTIKFTLSEEQLKKESVLYKPEVINDGICKGELIGGNLSLVSAAAGTPYGIKTLKNKLLFLEDIEERPYRIDRMLVQVLQSLNFSECQGIAMGIFEGCTANETEKSLTLMECFKELYAPLKQPIIYGLSFGHVSQQITLPYGIEAELNTFDKTLTLLQSAVSL